MRPLFKLISLLLLGLMGGLTRHARKRSKPFRNRSHRYDD